MVNFTAINPIMSNSSDYSLCRFEDYDPNSSPEKAKRAIFILLSIIGMLENVFIIAMVFKHISRSNLCYLVANMAVADSLYIIVGFYRRTTWLFSKTAYPDNQIWGDILCKVIEFAFRVSYRVSLVSLLIISIERFKVTRETLQRLKPYTVKQRFVVFGFCWLIPMAFAVYLLYEVKSLAGMCTVLPSNLAMSLLLSSADLASLISLVITFILSIITAKRLSKPQAIQAFLNDEERQKRAARTKAAVRMVLASVLLYTICWLPLFIIRFLRNFGDSIFGLTGSGIIIDLSVCIDWGSLNFVVYFFLPLINSCLSPCIYIMFLSEFREQAKKVFCSTACSRRNDELELQATGRLNNNRN